ncbi:MAG: protein-methionine-sulfoxide reductase heme-binding subunit MsrQ [Pseudomonadota bacterium]
MQQLADRVNTFVRHVPVWAIYLLCLMPVPWLFYLGVSGGLGVDPVKTLEQELGEIALQLLIIGLCITPLRRFLNVNFLRFRRAIGVLAFVYVCLHLLVWALLDVQSFDRVMADILKRPYITIGMASLVLLLPLAATSNNWSVRFLGPKWRQLHKLTYLAALLGGLHYLWLAKGFQLLPLAYLAVILILLGLRLKLPRRVKVGSA